MTAAHLPCRADMPFIRGKGLWARSLGQGAMGRLRFIKPLADGEPVGPKLDEIAHMMRILAASQREVRAQIGENEAVLREPARSIRAVGADIRAISTTVGEMTMQVRQMSADIVSLTRMLEGTGEAFIERFAADFEVHCGGLLRLYLRWRGITCDAVTIGKMIPDPARLGEEQRVGIYSEAPFAMGHSVLRLRDAGEASEFLSRARSVQKALGREGEEPLLYFFAMGANAEAKEEAIKILDEAKCSWHIGGTCSRKL